ncbi:MAG: Holliday junction branch migration protein RuvA [Acidimicrobiales bacterium]
MIGSLRGALLDRSIDGELLVEAGGVGYRVTTTPELASTIGAIGDEVFVHIHHHVREDAETLYGFRSKDERVCFEALLSAHGVGPSLALAIMSVHPPVQLHRVLAADDVDALCMVAGVGKKTATRLIVELKSKLHLPVVDLANLSDSSTSAERAVHADVRDALLGLGYTQDEIRRVLADLPAVGDPAQLVRQALQLMAVRV